jgi:hypothetical protein
LGEYRLQGLSRSLDALPLQKGCVPFALTCEELDGFQFLIESIYRGLIFPRRPLFAET